MKAIIYKYENKINKKIYIGQTINQKRRIESHKYCSKRQGFKFYNAVRKYGWDNFDYAVIIEIERENNQELKKEINELEKFYIKKFDSFKNGYNTTEGGEGMIGFKHSDKSKEKMSNRKKYLYDSGLLIPKFKKVLQFDSDKNLIKEWNSITEAAKVLNINSKHIIGCCKMKRKRTGGFMWFYEEDYRNDESRKIIENLINQDKKEDYMIRTCNPIYKLSFVGEIISEYRSCGLASKEFNKDNSRIIRNVCESMRKKILNQNMKHHRDFSEGFRWVYKSDYDNIELRIKIMNYISDYISRSKEILPS